MSSTKPSPSLLQTPLFQSIAFLLLVVFAALLVICICYFVLYYTADTSSEYDDLQDSRKATTWTFSIIAAVSVVGVIIGGVMVYGGGGSKDDGAVVLRQGTGNGTGVKDGNKGGSKQDLSKGASKEEDLSEEASQESDVSKGASEEEDFSGHDDNAGVETKEKVDEEEPKGTAEILQSTSTPPTVISVEKDKTYSGDELIKLYENLPNDAILNCDLEVEGKFEECTVWKSENMNLTVTGAAVALEKTVNSILHGKDHFIAKCCRDTTKNTLIFTMMPKDPTIGLDSTGITMQDCLDTDCKWHALAKIARIKLYQMVTDPKFASLQWRKKPVTVKIDRSITKRDGKFVAQEISLQFPTGYNPYLDIELNDAMLYRYTLTNPKHKLERVSERKNPTKRSFWAPFNCKEEENEHAHLEKLNKEIVSLHNQRQHKIFMGIIKTTRSTTLVKTESERMATTVPPTPTPPETLHDQRARLESLAQDERLPLDTRLDNLLAAPSSTPTDLLFVIDRLQIDGSSRQSAIRLLLERPDLGEHELACLLKRLVELCDHTGTGNVLVHPVMAAVMADTRLLRVSATYDLKLPTQIVHFLFTSDADDLIGDASLLAWWRAMVAREHQVLARSYLTCGRPNPQSVMLLCKVVEVSGADVGRVLASLGDCIPVGMLEGKELQTPNADLLAVMIRAALTCPSPAHYTAIRDRVTDTKNGNVMSVHCLCSLILACRFPAMDPLDLVYAPITVDPYLVGKVKEGLGQHAPLVDCLLVMSRAYGKVTIPCEPLQLEVFLRALILSLGPLGPQADHQRQQDGINLLLSLSAVSPSMATVVVQVCKSLLAHVVPPATIYTAMAKHSRSLPILTHLLDAIECDNVLFTVGPLLLAEPHVRQSTLDRVAARLRGVEAERFAGDCLEMWRLLVDLRYVSPLAVYTEIVKANGWHRSQRVFGIVGSMSLLPLVPSTPNQLQLDPRVQQCLLEHVVPVFSVESRMAKRQNGETVFGAIDCLSRFVDVVDGGDLILDFLAHNQVTMSAILHAIHTASLASPLSDPHADQHNVSILRLMVERDINQMPRHQLLALNQQPTSTVPHLQHAILTAILQNPMDPTQVPLTSIDSYPWFLRMEIVRALGRTVAANTEQMASVIETLSLAKQKEAVVLCAFLLAACKLAGVEVDVDVSRGVLGRLEGLARGGGEEHLLFALACLGCALGTQNAVTTFPEAMAAALFAPIADPQLALADYSHLEPKLQLPFAHVNPHCVNLNGIPLDDLNYHQYLLQLVNCSDTKVEQELAKALWKHTTMLAVREPLDMQGCLHYFTSACCGYTVPAGSVNAMPVARLAHHFAAMSANCATTSANSDTETAVVAERAGKRVIPWVDWLFYRREIVRMGTKSAGSQEIDNARFSATCAFRLLFECSDQVIDKLGIFAEMDTLPVMDWSGVLQKSVTPPWPFMLKHVIIGGSQKRTNKSIVAYIERILGEEVVAGEIVLEAARVGVSVDFARFKRPLCHSTAIGLLNVGVSNALCDCLLECIDSSALNVEITSVLVEKRYKPTVKQFLKAMDIVKAHREGNLVEFVNDVDCGEHHLLLSQLLTRDEVELVRNKLLQSSIRSHF